MLVQKTINQNVAIDKIGRWCIAPQFQIVKWIR